MLDKTDNRCHPGCCASTEYQDIYNHTNSFSVISKAGINTFSIIFHYSSVIMIISANINTLNIMRIYNKNHDLVFRRKINLDFELTNMVGAHLDVYIPIRRMSPRCLHSRTSQC